MSFNDKVVLVTGASSGIGAAIAIKFAEQGAKVALIGRKQDKLKTVEAKCEKCLVIVADVSKDEDCKRVVNQTIAHFGQIDVLINNAGISGAAPITAEHVMQVFDQVMATNFRSAVYITHLAAPHLIKTKGNIINISSIAGIRAYKGNFIYNTSKAAMDHFMKSAALDLAPNGVRVNSINPGPVKTDIFVNSGVPDDKVGAIWEMLVKNTALGRMSEPEEIADLALFIASEKAKAITGSIFTSDNGALLAGSFN